MTPPVALVTGGSRGIGRAVCVDLARHGYSVVAAGRDTAALAQTAAQVAEAGGECYAVQCDAGEPAAVAACVQGALARYGQIDLLVNNAGGGTTGRPLPSEEVPLPDWQNSLQVNLTSAFAFCQAVIPVMKARRSGCIVNVASVAARQASHLSGAAYSAAKSGLVGMSRHLARELGPFGIRVNTVAPGIIASPRVRNKIDQLSEQEQAQLLGRIPLGRIGGVVDVAAVVSFLASDAASYIHGALIDINGGLYMA